MRVPPLLKAEVKETFAILLPRRGVDIQAVDDRGIIYDRRTSLEVGFIIGETVYPLLGVCELLRSK